MLKLPIIGPILKEEIADLLAMPGLEETEVEITALRDLAQPADLS